MNKQSNLYTTVYIILLVLIVGTALAGTALALKSRQQANADADKMRQIMAAALITPDASQVIADYQKYIVESFVVNSKGEKVDADAFSVNVADQTKLNADSRQLPVYVCKLDDGSLKYILPVYGAGLWGPIWGYVSVDSNGSTIYGAYFAHQGETPGLGAEIEKPWFSDQFKNKNLFIDNAFMPIAVVKKGQKPQGPEDYVDGVSGGTITSKGVGEMLDKCLKPYEAFLKTLSTK